MFRGIVMREFVVTLSYEPGVDPLADTFIDHPEVTAQSTTCVATTDHVWRADTLFGPEDDLDRIETRFLDESQVTSVTATGVAPNAGTRCWSGLRPTDSSTLTAARSGAVDPFRAWPWNTSGRASASRPSELATPTSRTVLMLDDEGVGRLYDAAAQFRAGVRLGLQHVTGHLGWRSGALAAPRLSHAQREAVRAAVVNGYYETPRACTITELSDRLDVARSTLQYRLQRAESQLLAAFVEQLP